MTYYRCKFWSFILKLLTLIVRVIEIISRIFDCVAPWLFATLPVVINVLHSYEFDVLILYPFIHIFFFYGFLHFSTHLRE